MKSRGLEVEREVRVATPGGKKETRIIDAVGRKDGKIVEMHQAGRGLKSNPDKQIARERDAFRDMRRVPELKNAKRVFNNYKNPKSKRR
jgi:hypothetical protein